MDNLRELKVFTDVDVKRLKSDENLKARFVARGFSQVIEDPDLIDAATPQVSSLKLLLTVAAQK
eukprot:491635-Amphidinium_carterae.1